MLKFLNLGEFRNLKFDPELKTKNNTDLIVNGIAILRFYEIDTVDNINNEHKHQNIETGQLKSIKRQHTSQDGKN